MRPLATGKPTWAHVHAALSWCADVLFYETPVPPGLTRKAIPIAPHDTWALFSYQHSLVRTAILRMKYHKSMVVPRYFAQEFILQLVTDKGGKIQIPPSGLTIVPVPAGSWRMKKYGYSHMERFARSALYANNVRGTGALPLTLALALKKHKDTPRQTETASKAERLRNIAGSMHVKKPDLIRGKTVILVDDIYTTGATIAEASRALTRAGATKIYVYCIAH